MSRKVPIAEPAPRKKDHAFFWSLVLLGLTILFFRVATHLFRTGLRMPGMMLSMAGMLILIAELVLFLPVLYRNAFHGSSLPGRFRVTAGGWIFLLMVLLLGLAAVNTGNNLLYIVLSFLIATIVVSGIVSRVSLRNVRIALDFPDVIFAGESVVGRLTVVNGKRFAASFSIGVECRLFNETFSGVPAAPVKRQPRLARKRRAPREVPLVRSRVYAPAIGPRLTAAFTFPVRFDRRGLYRIQEIELGTAFPFGFFRKTRILEGNGELIVYPNPAEPDEVQRIIEERLEDQPTDRKGPGSEIYALRDYVDGEDIRLVHWKVSARIGRLITRDFTKDGKERIRVLFDQAAPGESGEETGEGRDSARFEKALSILAYLTLESKGEGNLLEIAFSHPGEGEPESESDDDALLRRLALARMAPPPETEPAHPFNSPVFLSAAGHEIQERYILVSFRPPGAFGALAGCIDIHVDMGAL
ncbi:MAG: DUF58 domain-containing protein [Acidobacteria bacterium]|nr:DUF58 domain-containing protein [Acidobacteriota bacterium]